MTFTSNKSMEIEVFVDADPFVDESQERYRAVSAFFTYVSLSKEGKPLPVPQLVVFGSSDVFDERQWWGTHNACSYGARGLLRLTSRSRKLSPTSE
ncbi:UNVERIFIED_CONTAM: hypothetical protein K2H54_018817 [Gekko kuhli]